MDLAPGAVIAGRYRVDTRVGAGGMGEVWAGEHLGIGVKVAIKTLLPAASVSHEVVVRFKREAMLLGRIRSDYVARILDFIQDDTYGLVLVMEYIEGDPLSKVLGFRCLTVEEAIDLGADMAAALCDLHRAHVVHRDLKPGNVILMPLADGKRKRAVLVDFGVSRMVSDGGDEDTITGITRANMAVGTVEYMAPEQVLSSRDVTTASDCYALGAILYRAVAGRHVYGDVFDNELAHTKLTKDAPPLVTGRTDRVAIGLERVVARSLKRRPSERWKSAEEMLAELEALRDLARAANLDAADTTTVDGSDLDIETISKSEPLRDKASSPSGEVAARASMPSIASSPAVVTAPALELAPPAKPKGVPRAVAIVAALVAAAAGVALGVFAVRQHGEPTAPPSPAAAETAPAPVVTATAPAPAPTLEPEPTAAATAAAPAPSAEPTTIDLGEIEPPAASSKRARSAAKPSSTPSASRSASPEHWIPPVDSTTGAVTPASTSKPAAQATSTPQAAPSSAPKAPPPPEKIEF